MEVERMIDILNDFLRIDPKAARAMFAHRVKLSPDRLALQPLPFYVRDEPGTGTTLGLLGMLNGLLDDASRVAGAQRKRIAGCYDGDTLVGFQLFKEPHE